MKVETYWNYTVKSRGQSEKWENGKAVPLEEPEDVLEYDINQQGKYSSLKQAINGFLDECTNNFSKVKIDFFDNEKIKFKLTTEVYYDRLGEPINDVLFRRWKNGEYPIVKHCYVDAIFIEHINRQGTISDYSEIMGEFPNILIED